MTDLTLKKMREAIKLVDGTWPDSMSVKDNQFYINSRLNKIDYGGIDRVKQLGFEDVMIYAGSNSFAFTFFWKKDKVKKK